MKIVRDDIKTKVFADLKEGAVFQYLDDFYIKTDEIFSTEMGSEFSYRYNAVRLLQGDFNLIADYEEVRIFPEAFLTIK